ncbi:hypothetical protein [Legionella hackeliae]|nr:hypothetical protein [Legionella hackeliae]
MIDEMEKWDEYSKFSNYLSIFTQEDHVIALGGYDNKDTPTVEGIKKTLMENNPEDLIQIMFIHFKFAQKIYRSVPIKTAPAREPVGKFADIVKEFWRGDPKEFFTKGIANGWEGQSLRSCVADAKMYNSRLYTAWGNRGREGYMSSERTHQLGLMLNSQREYEVGFPTHRSQWATDCKNQGANLSSPYVVDLIENHAVYVAGPSGMTSMFLGQMEVVANFENEELKKNYLAAVASYIVGGGFHSLHEVIGPAQYTLNLVPDYNVSVPENGKLALPPNYNQFFKQQAAIDPEFSARREAAWQRYLTYFNDSYAPKHIEGFAKTPLALTSDDVEYLSAGELEIAQEIPADLRERI